MPDDDSHEEGGQEELLRELRPSIEAAKEAAEEAKKHAATAKQEAAEAKRQASDAAAKAGMAAINGAQALDRALEDAESARADLNAADRSNAYEELERKARSSLRGYVANVLSEIAAGVDDAAIHATSRDLTEGMSEGGMISPSRIGLVPGRDVETTVEFDLAIISRKAERHTNEQGVEADVSVGISVLGLGASLGGGWTRTSEQRQSTDQHNRIRFAVPIKFASQRERQ